MLRGIIVTLLVAGCGRIGFDDVAPRDGSSDASSDAVVDAPMIDASTACLGAWCRRKAIIVDNTQVIEGPYVNFPMLVSLAGDADLAANARIDGFDIRFTAADGTTLLSYERQRYVAATGQLIAWVRVPLLLTTTDTTIYMYYGNPAALDQQEPTSTWNASYQGVWHFDETIPGPGQVRDSTANANHGTPENGVALGAAGFVGSGFVFDGVDDHVFVPDSTSLDAAATMSTISAWVRFADPSDGGFQYVMTSANSFAPGLNGLELGVQADGDTYFYPWTGDSNDFNLILNPFGDQTWHYLVVTMTFATKTVAFNVDGVAKVNASMNTPAFWTAVANPTGWLWGGNPDSPAKYFTGMIDEVRVSTTIHAPSQNATEYRNQTAPGLFYELGPEVVLQ